MDQASNSLDTILQADSKGTASPVTVKTGKSQDLPDAQNAHDNETKAKNDKRKRLSELDFSSFFQPAKGEDGDKTVGSGSILTDKLFEKFLSLVAPLDGADAEQNKVLHERLKMQKSRPQLSATTMSKNTTSLNARLSSPFIFLDNVINFFNWSDPYYTIGIQIFATHLVLNPYLVLIMPIVLVISNILIPHYLLIYPPDQTILTYLDQNPIPSYNQLEKYKIPQPVNQFSREFYINLTDLQNFQVLYIQVWDFMVWLTNDYLYFKNETLSAIFCLILMVIIPVDLLILPKLVPFLLTHLYLIKTYCLVLIWGVPLLLHPEVRTIIIEWICREDTRLNTQDGINHIELYLCSYLVRPDEKYQIKDTDDFDVNEVEIFELQEFDPKTKIWNLKGFSNSFYTINSPIRKYNIELLHDSNTAEDQKPYYAINKKLTIEDVNPPIGWKFVESKWSLDLKVMDWVEHNLIHDLVSIDEDEKWVYDYNNQEDEKNISVYRRRRWIRTCRRETYLDREAKEKEKDAHQNWEFR